jgi:hypothetical protein
MGSIPISEAIKFGGWLEYCGKSWDGPIVFRFKVLSFARPAPTEMSPQAGTPAFEGVLWALSMEVVSLKKTPLSPGEIHHILKIVDQDGFAFPICRSLHQLGGSIHVAVNRLSTPTYPLLPKIKVAGTMLFALPDEESTYSIELRDGVIKEA